MLVLLLLISIISNTLHSKKKRWKEQIKVGILHDWNLLLLPCKLIFRENIFNYFLYFVDFSGSEGSYPTSFEVPGAGQFDQGEGHGGGAEGIMGFPGTPTNDQMFPDDQVGK